MKHDHTSKQVKKSLRTYSMIWMYVVGIVGIAGSIYAAIGKGWLVAAIVFFIVGALAIWAAYIEQHKIRKIYPVNQSGME